MLRLLRRGAQLDRTTSELVGKAPAKALTEGNSLSGRQPDRAPDKCLIDITMTIDRYGHLMPGN